MRVRSPRQSLMVGLVAVVLTLSACAPSPNSRTAVHVAPLPVTSLTPQGWSPVSLGDVQISVPSDWFIEDPEWICGGGVQGMVFINQTPTPPPGGMGCSLPPNVIEMSTAPSTAPSNSHRFVINSIPTAEGSMRSGSTSIEVVRALGMDVEASGPLAEQVMATLTHSPLSVVLNSSADSVPPSWQHVVFGGIRFAVPGDWTRRGTSGGDCPGNIEANVLVLSTAQSLSASSCGGPPPETAVYLAANPGMELGSGPSIQAAPPHATCLTRQGLRICVDPPPSPGGGFVPGQELNLLTAQVKVAGRSALDQIEIGLTGTGVTPLQILDSIRPVKN